MAINRASIFYVGALIAVLLNGPSIQASENKAGNFISFRDAFSRMMDNDFGRRLGLDNVERVEALKWESYAQFLPSVTLSASNNRNNQFDPTTRLLNTTVNLGLWRNGVDYLGIRQQDHNMASAQSGSSMENLRAEKRTTKVLFDYLWRRQVLTVRRSIADARKEIVQLTKARFEQGLVPEQQVLAAELDLENAESQFTFALQDLQDSKVEIERSIGPMALDPLAEAYLHSKSEVEKSTLPALEQDWPYLTVFSSNKIKRLVEENPDKEARPDYQQLRRANEASELSVLRAKGSFLPVIDFQMQRNQTTFNATGRRFDETTYALTLTAPLFENLGDYVAYKQSAYNNLAARYQLLEFDQKFTADFSAKKLILERGLERMQAREQILKKGERLFKVMRAQYLNGRQNYQELALEQERFFNSSLNYQQGLLELHNALVDYCHALGRTVNRCLDN